MAILQQWMVVIQLLQMPPKALHSRSRERRTSRRKVNHNKSLTSTTQLPCLFNGILEAQLLLASLGSWRKSHTFWPCFVQSWRRFCFANRAMLHTCMHQICMVQATAVQSLITSTGCSIQPSNMHLRLMCDGKTQVANTRTKSIQHEQ